MTTRSPATRQLAYLQAVTSTVLPLKTKAFKVEAAPDEKVGDKPATVVKGTGPDGKTFVLYFDKETGLPPQAGRDRDEFPG